MFLQDEIQLINRFKSGDQAVFEKFVQTYQDRIYNLCIYLLGNRLDAEDAAQDVFIKAFQNLAQFNPKASLFTWLYRIGVNTCLDYKRKSRHVSDQSDVLNHQPSTVPSPEKYLQSQEIGLAIQAALRQLPKPFRAIIVLKEIEGLGYEEIAEVMNISIGTVKSKLSRGREELRRILKNKI
ncbi:MAG TPA: sigma-70 family RNA polymerase sigma factor [Thermodesulfobacteriota bacterium]|nr:sigma-70 family RNA polymerase sigma factor [Thermodesulfobacteriota bacterium]